MTHLKLQKLPTSTSPTRQCAVESCNCNFCSFRCVIGR